MEWRSIIHLFWVDPISIVDYHVFGEDATFDNTYKTKKYNMSLSLFCGANHHKSTVIFAIDFLSNKTIVSFIWLFTEFQKFMGRATMTFITNQNPTMNTTLQEGYPTIFHWLCKWHITNKIGDKIGNVYRNWLAMDEFFSLLNDS